MLTRSALFFLGCGVCGWLANYSPWWWLGVAWFIFMILIQGARK